MGESWTVFAVPAGAADRVWAACRNHFGEDDTDLSTLTLIRGPAIEGGVPFAIDQVVGSYASLLDDDVVVGLLSGDLETEVWALSGDSHTDSCHLEIWRDGEQTDAVDTTFGGLGEVSARTGVDLVELRSWASFGISGAEPYGVRYPLAGDGEPSARDRAEQAVAAAGGSPEQRDAAARTIDGLVDSGALPPAEAALYMLQLGRAQQAVDLARHGTSGVHREILVKAAIAAGTPEAAAHLADDTNVSGPLRFALLEALGRGEEALTLRIASDLEGSAGYGRLAGRALDHPDPAERIRRLEALSFGTEPHPGWELVRRCQVALARLQMGEPVPADLLEALEKRTHPALDGYRDMLRAGADPIAALRTALDRAAGGRDEELLARAHGDLGLALLAAGAPDAARHLEEAYIRLGTATPYTKAIHAALVKLGLL